MTLKKFFFIVACAFVFAQIFSTAAFAGRVDPAFNQAHLKAINEEREKRGIKPLTLSKTLQKAVAIRAKELEERYAHERPDGRSCFTVLDDVDPDFAWGASGENIAMRQNTVAMVMTDWMNSKAHRENILNSDFARVGVATYVDDDGWCFWVQMFSSNAPDADYYGEDDGDNGGDGGYRDPTKPIVDTLGGCSTGAGAIALISLSAISRRRRQRGISSFAHDRR